MRKVFVLVPSLVPTGPIKGAIALCNAFVDRCEVTLVPLKPTDVEAGGLDPRVRVVSLARVGGWRAKLAHYRALLVDAGHPVEVASLSLGLSADVVNVFVRRYAVTFASIRGHLHRTYRIDYGFMGVLIAVMHYWVMARSLHVIAMTEHMARQYARIAFKRPQVVGNFVDETALEPFRCTRTISATPIRFVYVGRLSPLKRPELLINAIARLVAEGTDCSLDVYGDGPLRNDLEAHVSERDLGTWVRFHGQVVNPWVRASEAHCLVLPSLTEGISRAVMEALYLGLPCVLRDVDSNAEVVQPGDNGALFRVDAELPEAMLSAARIGMTLAAPRPVLLTDQFRQRPCAERYFQLLQES